MSGQRGRRVITFDISKIDILALSSDGEPARPDLTVFVDASSGAAVDVTKLNIDHSSVVNRRSASLEATQKTNTAGGPLQESGDEDAV